MKTLISHINEALKIGNNISKFSTYSCQPTSKDELKSIIDDRIEKEGFNCDLNDIDTSLITDMSELFADSKFNGNISKWDVSNVKYMSEMFADSFFNGDISEWNVSNVLDMSLMFIGSLFNQDISNWNIHEHCNTFYMFNNCKIADKFIPTRQMYARQFASARLEFK